MRGACPSQTLPMSGGQPPGSAPALHPASGTPLDSFPGPKPTTRRRRSHRRGSEDVAGGASREIAQGRSQSHDLPDLVLSYLPLVLQPQFTNLQFFRRK